MWYYGKPTFGNLYFIGNTAPHHAQLMRLLSIQKVDQCFDLHPNQKITARAVRGIHKQDLGLISQVGSKSLGGSKVALSLLW